ncbi:unnamed protein product [Heterobilharzia americana]|nr:unnamed protein product [Heterobilharzia americana]
MFENCYILGHLRLRLSTSILLELQSINSAATLTSWSLKSVDLKLHGLRVAVLEELIDLLNWKLFAIRTTTLSSASSTTSSAFSSPTQASSSLMSSYTCCHLVNYHHSHQDHCQTIDHSFHADNSSSILEQPCDNTLNLLKSNKPSSFYNSSDNEIIQSHLQCVQQTNSSIKLCITFLPLQFSNSNHRRQHDRNQQISSIPEMGFHFEIIRYSFKSSLQFYFISSHLSMEFELPKHMKCLHDDFGISQISSEPCLLSHSTKLDHSITSTHTNTATTTTTSIVLLGFRFYLEHLRLLNGWSTQAKHCLLEAKVNLIEITEQLESSICSVYLNVICPCIFYTHENTIELEFYKKLITYYCLVGQWWKVFHRSTTGTDILPISSLNNLQNNTNEKVDMIKYWRHKKFIKMLQYFGLNTRQLNARIHFCGNKSTNSSTVGGSDACSTLQEAVEFSNDSEQHYHHYDHQVFMERMRSTDIPQALLVFIPHPDSYGLQLGLLNSLVNLQCDFHEFNVEKPIEILNSIDFNLTSSSVHICLLDKIDESIIDKTKTFQSSLSSTVYSLSSLNLSNLDSLRSHHSNIIYSHIRRLPSLNEHYWGYLLYVHEIDIWNHKSQIGFKLVTVRMEWPSSTMTKLVDYLHWQCLTSHVEGSNQVPHTENSKIALKEPDYHQPMHFSDSVHHHSTEDYLKSSIQFDGFLENVNVFLLSGNNAFLMLRVDNQRLLLLSSSQLTPPSHYANKSSFNLNGSAQITLTGCKLIYNSSVLMPNYEYDVTSACPYTILSSAEIKDDSILLLPEVQVDIKLPDKSIEISPVESGEFVWSLGFHLCCRSILISWGRFTKKFLSGFNHLFTPYTLSKCYCQQSESFKLLPSPPFTSSLTTSTSAVIPDLFKNSSTRFPISNNTKNDNTVWKFSLKTNDTNFQLYFKLLSKEHFIVLCIDKLSFYYYITKPTINHNSEMIVMDNIGSVVGSRLKLNCENVVFKCEDQTIAVFQNLKVCQRPENIQHRIEHLKMGLMNRENSSWEFYMDLLYVIFPYRYKFRDIYQEVTSIRKFLLQLHFGDIIYPEPDVLSNPIKTSPIYTPIDLDVILNQFSIGSPSNSPSLSPLSPPILKLTSTTNRTQNTSLTSSLLSDSETSSPKLSSLKQDHILHIKRFIIEIKDDPFECKLNDIHTILLDEFAMHERRVNTVREELTRAAHSGIRVSDEERLACFARMEIQRANEYRNRLNHFYQDYAISDELFTFTMDNLKIKALADGSLTSGEQAIEQMKMMDSESPWPNLTHKDFCTLWCRIITLNVDRWRFQLRDYPKPCWDVTDLFLWGKLVVAEQLASDIGQRKVFIEPGKPWPGYILIRNSSPTKFYYDLNADVKSLHICYGANWEPTISWLNQRLDDIKPMTKDKSCPPLGWWDKSRLLLHGRLLFAADSMHWLYSTSLSPYNTTEFFTWQWNHVVVNWENGVIRVDGDLDITFSLPRLEMTVRLDWLSLRDPNDHHSVKHCHTECLPTSEQNQHDSYKYFRANRLAMQVNFTVKPPPSGSSKTDQRPWCLLYTSVLKFADKLRVCLSQISRPIRRGSLYNYNPPRKPNFGRLLQSLDFSFNLPQLEMIFWVSYAKRTGVHLTTGPIQVIGKLKREIENEIKVRRLIGKLSNSFHTPTSSTIGVGSGTFDASCSTILHPYVMIPPRSAIQRNGLSRRPIASWSVINLFASVHDSAIRLRHRDNLPGPLVQMLLQCVNTHQNNTNIKQSDTGHDKPDKNSVSSELELDNEVMNDAEAFIIVPLLRYQQLCPSVLPPNTTVRVHIPGPRSTTITTTAASSSNNNEYNKNGGLVNQDIDVTGIEHPGNPDRISTAEEVAISSDSHQLTHEELTPVHHLEIHEFKMRWTEQNRNLVYILMDSYQHAQLLKRNLSTRALHGFKLDTGQTGTNTTMMTTTTGGGFGIGSLLVVVVPVRFLVEMLVVLFNYQVVIIINRQPIVTSTDSHHILSNTDHVIKMSTTSAGLFTGSELLPHISEIPPTTKNNSTVGKDKSDNEYEHNECEQYSVWNTTVSTEASRKSKSHLEQIPMLAQLLEEVDTARFYAYCEEEPKQTDVVSQLQGLKICASSLVAERNWHLELINPQLLLKTNHLAGYVLVTAARAKLDALTHPPVWKDSQLLNKSSLVGHLECMQYYATVGQVLPGTPDQWLSTADVSDWAHHSLNADEDTLSGKPEVVGCGRSVGGVVTACVGFPQNLSSNKSSLTRHSVTATSPITSTSVAATEIIHSITVTSLNTTPTAATTTTTIATAGLSTDCVRPIQLQRMISRCSCEVFYIHYEPADPANLPLPHLIPPLSLDETEVVRNPEGADTVTLLHHTLNVFTNSLQYHMIVEIVNDLLLYVEPQRKAQSERNRVAFGLMSESQVRLAILRDQEALRRMILEQRQLERYLWSYVSQTMQELGLNTPVGYPKTFHSINNILSKNSNDSTYCRRRSSNITLKLVNCIQGARHLETQINTLKSSIIDLNAILSQRLAHYQQLQIQAQRRHIRKAMSFKRHPLHSSSSSSFNNDFLYPSTTISNTGIGITSGSGGGLTLNSPNLIQKQSVEDFNRISQLGNDSESPVTCGLSAQGNLRRSSSIDYLLHANVCNSRNNVSQNQSVAEAVLSDSSRKSTDSGSKPAEVVRRSEVCFEHARWRMTEHDGQIGLADVELRGFIYTKTNRQDDSGSHRLELGWIRVSSLAPNSFYKEVLAPDVSGGRYAGGPILRIACSDLAPVGGISVKEAMEISVAPIVLQMSKQFYRIMMPFFFPEKSEDTHTTSVVTTTVATTNSTTNNCTTVSNQIAGLMTNNNLINSANLHQLNSLHLECINSNAFTSYDGDGIVPFHHLESNPDNQRFLDSSDNILSRKQRIRRYLSRYFPHRQPTTTLLNENETCQQLNFPQKYPIPDVVDNTASSSMSHIISTTFSSPPSTSSTTVESMKSISPSNLTIEAAISGRNYCSVNDEWNGPVNRSTFSPAKLLQMNLRRKLPLENNLPIVNSHSLSELKYVNSIEGRANLLPQDLLCRERLRTQMDYFTGGEPSTSSGYMKGCYINTDMKMMMAMTTPTQPQSQINLCTRVDHLI